MAKIRILIVDDEVSILKLLRVSLEDAGYEVVSAIDGVDAIDKMEGALPHLVILDVTMPRMDGFEVCRRVREWSNVPIIILPARSDKADILKAFNLGADDYVLKPFSVDELNARVKAVLRRNGTGDETAVPPVFTSGNLSIDFAGRQVSVAGNRVDLTPTEFSLLKELTLNSGKVLTYAYLLGKVWGPEYKDEREYLHVFIARLRAKLEGAPSEPKRIVTVSGVGYQFLATS
ncbi:MAG TPA: response regulator transcription factor [Dehalococcoidales bacterium]|nr:response regulator transcription factor [Dehalococcoidales bacterium]